MHETSLTVEIKSCFQLPLCLFVNDSTRVKVERVKKKNAYGFVFVVWFLDPEPRVCAVFFVAVDDAAEPRQQLELLVPVAHRVLKVVVHGVAVFRLLVVVHAVEVQPDEVDAFVACFKI